MGNKGKTTSRKRGPKTRQKQNIPDLLPEPRDANVPRPNVSSIPIFENKTATNRIRTAESKAQQYKKNTQFTVNKAFRSMPVYKLSNIDLLVLRRRPRPCVQDRSKSALEMKKMKDWPAHGLSGIWKDKNDKTLLAYLSWRPETKDSEIVPVNNLSPYNNEIQSNDYTCRPQKNT